MRRPLTISLVCLGLAACGNPIDRVEKLDQVDLAEDAVSIGALPSPEELERTKTGLFARLFSRTDPNAPQDTSAEDRVVQGALADLKAPEDTLADQPASKAAATDAKTAQQGKEQGAGQDQDQPDPQLALLSPDPVGKKRGWFGFLKPGGADAAKLPEGAVAFGAQIPFGQVAPICDVKPRDMGKKVATYPEKRPLYTLYDSKPGEKAPHTFYVTGFADGCARQVTASVVLFGSVAMHEQLRYGLPAKVQPYSDTDKAYEKVKRRVCGVGRKTPCGDKISKLERDTVFLSFYDRYGDARGWANLLLHDGRLLAQDLKTN